MNKWQVEAHNKRKFWHLVQFILKEMYRRMSWQRGVDPKRGAISWTDAAQEISEYLLEQDLLDPEEIMG